MQARIRSIVRLREEARVFKLLSALGKRSSDVERIPESLDYKPKKGETYWYYSGPLDDKTRPFCKRMLLLDKVFSQKDIDTLSRYLNYDVLEFVGAYNCRHQWVKFTGKEILTPKPTVKQINDLIRDGVKVK